MGSAERSPVLHTIYLNEIKLPCFANFSRVSIKPAEKIKYTEYFHLREVWTA